MTILLFTGEKKSTHQFGCAGVLCLCAYSAAIHKKGRKSQPSLARCTPVMSNLGHLFFSLLQRWRGGRHKLTMPLFQRSYSVCLSMYTATNVCFERAYMHGTSLSLWFNMHNWSIHYCKTGAACFSFQRMEVPWKWLTVTWKGIALQPSSCWLSEAGKCTMLSLWVLSGVSCFKRIWGWLFSLVISKGGFTYRHFCVWRLGGEVESHFLVGYTCQGLADGGICPRFQLKVNLFFSAFNIDIQQRDSASIASKSSKVFCWNDLLQLCGREVDINKVEFPCLLQVGTNVLLDMLLLIWQRFQRNLWHHQRHWCHVF